MKKAAYQDIECICDEKVVRRLDLKGKKIYASTILETAARGKKGGCVRHTFFERKAFGGNEDPKYFYQKEQMGYVFSAFLTAAVIGGTCLWNIRENGGQQAYDDSLDPGEAAGEEGNRGIPVVDVDSPEELELPEEFHLEDFYITNRTAAGNRFYIDSESVLWGIWR